MIMCHLPSPDLSPLLLTLWPFEFMPLCIAALCLLPLCYLPSIIASNVVAFDATPIVIVVGYVDAARLGSLNLFALSNSIPLSPYKHKLLPIMY